MASNIKCPKCNTQFTPEDPSVPLMIPSCRHTLCSGCMPGTEQCPVEHCHALVSRMDREVTLVLGKGIAVLPFLQKDLC